ELETSIPGSTGSGTSTVTIPFAVVTGQIFFLAQEGNDTLTIDRSLGLFSNIVSFDGGGPATPPGDRLIITGGSAINLASVNYFNASDGILLFDSEIFVFSGLEPVDLSAIVVANYVFNLTFNNDQAILEDEGIQGNNIVQLRSINGTFETTIFQNPTISLTINLLDGDDTFSVGSGASAPNDFSAALTVQGDDGNDTILLSGALLLGASDAQFSAETIAVTGSVVTTGNITADAATVLTGTATGLLQGNLVTLISGTSIGTFANPIHTNANVLTPLVGTGS
ncbi:MAG TPA: hypothetical protein PKD72_05115, partial [Gemmatales bacterium]|nr:hypothetical protein [Gemmatales bacterium]